jgi:hypothetical protein
MSKISSTEITWEFEGSEARTFKVTYEDKSDRDYVSVELATYEEGERDKYICFEMKDLVELHDIITRILNTQKLK